MPLKFVRLRRSWHERDFRSFCDGKWKRKTNLGSHQAAEEHKQSGDEALGTSTCINKNEPLKLWSTQDLRDCTCMYSCLTGLTQGKSSKIQGIVFSYNIILADSDSEQADLSMEIYLRDLRCEWLIMPTLVLPAPEAPLDSGPCISLYACASKVWFWSAVFKLTTSMLPTSDSAPPPKPWPLVGLDIWSSEDRLRSAAAALAVPFVECDKRGATAVTCCSPRMNGKNAPAGRCVELKKSLELVTELCSCSGDWPKCSCLPTTSSGDEISFCRDEVVNNLKL